MPVVGIIKNVPRVEIQQIQVTDWINKQLTTDAKLLEPFKTTVWDANGSVVSCANFSIHRQSFPSRSDKSDRTPSEICTDHEKYDNFLVEKIWHLDKGTWHTKYIWSPPTRQNHTPKKHSFFFPFHGRNSSQLLSQCQCQPPQHLRRWGGMLSVHVVFASANAW